MKVKLNVLGLQGIICYASAPSSFLVNLLMSAKEAALSKIAVQKSSVSLGLIWDLSKASRAGLLSSLSCCRRGWQLQTGLESKSLTWSFRHVAALLTGLYWSLTSFANLVFSGWCHGSSCVG